MKVSLGLRYKENVLCVLVPDHVTNCLIQTDFNSVVRVRLWHVYLYASAFHLTRRDLRRNNIIIPKSYPSCLYILQLTLHSSVSYRREQVVIQATDSRFIVQNLREIESRNM